MIVCLNLVSSPVIETWCVFAIAVLVSVTRCRGVVVTNEKSAIHEGGPC